MNFMMDVYKYTGKVHVVMKRQKSSIFYVATEIDTVMVLKKFVAKLFNIDVANLRLTYQDRELYNTVRLFEYGISPKIALPHSPAVIGIQLRRTENDKFERLVIVNPSMSRKLSVTESSKNNDNKKNSKDEMDESANKSNNEDRANDPHDSPANAPDPSIITVTESTGENVESNVLTDPTQTANEPNQVESINSPPNVSSSGQDVEQESADAPEKGPQNHTENPSPDHN